MKNGDRSQSIPSRKTIGQLDAMMTSALDCLQAQLHQRFSEMLDNADEYLSNLSEIRELEDESDDEPDDVSDDESNNETVAKEAHYEKLIRILHSEHSNIEKSFFKAINENQNNRDRTQNDELTLSNKLSLVDQDDMDEMVAVTAMYSNAMSKYEEEVNNLEARIEYLEMSSNTMLPKHMFDPRHICEAFQTALKQVEMPIDYKLSLFRLFDQEVSSRLGDMYQSLNQLFIDAGVMPEVVYQVKNQNPETHSASVNRPDGSSGPNDIRSQDSFAVPDSRDHDVQSNASGNNIPNSHEEINRFISQCMSGVTSAKGEGIPQSFATVPTETDSQICYSRNDLMNALSKLQTNLATVDINNGSAIDAEHIKRAIIADMARSNGGAITKTVHTLDQRCIDFVGMIFQAIAEDQSISMVITNLLMLLQIPILKIAMLDEALFTEKDHPARHTLDLITKAGRGVTEDSDRVYIELKKIVDGILHEYEVVSASFDKAADELRALIRKEEQISAENEKNEQQEIIKQHAREVVLIEMRRITINKVVPKDIRPLMLKLWPTLMFNHYINNGIESSNWHSSLKVFNMLMKYLQPIKNKTQWQKLNDNHESLVETVKEELYKTRQDRAAINSQITALRQIFVRMLDACRNQFEEEPEIDVTEQASITAGYDEADISEVANGACEDNEHDDKAARIEEQVRIAREKISRLPTDLHPGAWFEVFNGEDKPVRRLKLSVILTEVAKLIFVDRQGTKVMEKDADDFLNELDHGLSRLIADHSTFEHALGSVIHKLVA
jgi:hypothetical protein